MHIERENNHPALAGRSSGMFPLRFLRIINTSQNALLPYLTNNIVILHDHLNISRNTTDSNLMKFTIILILAFLSACKPAGILTSESNTRDDQNKKDGTASQSPGPKHAIPPEEVTGA